MANNTSCLYWHLPFWLWTDCYKNWKHECEVMVIGRRVTVAIGQRLWIWCTGFSWYVNCDWYVFIYAVICEVPLTENYSLLVLLSMPDIFRCCMCDVHKFSLSKLVSHVGGSHYSMIHDTWYYDTIIKYILFDGYAHVDWIEQCYWMILWWFKRLIVDITFCELNVFVVRWRKGQR